MLVQIDVTEEEAFLLVSILIQKIGELQQQPADRATDKSIEVLQQFLAKLTPPAFREQALASLN